MLNVWFFFKKNIMNLRRDVNTKTFVYLDVSNLVVPYPTYCLYFNDTTAICICKGRFESKIFEIKLGHFTFYTISWCIGSL